MRRNGLLREMRVLVTRPQDDAAVTAAKLTAMGHEAILAPLMRIQFRDGEAIGLGGVQAILATSANGVRAIARRIARRDIPLFAVGRQTAQAARESGFEAVRSADGDGAALAEATAQWASPRNGTLLHAAGARTKGDLAATLRARGFAVRTEILYEAVAATALPPLPALDAVLLYSPRGARTFARLARAAGISCAGMMAVCISRAAADALDGLAFRQVLVAGTPDQDALLARLPAGL
jgi:uroporphyrinogen-III synthase